MFIFLLFILVVIALFIAAGIYFLNIAIHPKNYTIEQTCEFETNAGKLNKEEFERLEHQQVYIDSPYGYKLYGLFFPNGNSKKTVIIAHGITYSLYGSVKYMNIFLKRGFNVFLYEHRNHGRSGGTNTTFGFYEKYDLKACTDWVIEKCGKDSIIGMHGESMGAATILQNAAIEKRVAFYIADCPYSDLNSLFRCRIKIEYHLPAFPILNIASLFAKLNSGFFFSQVSPIKDMSNIDTPIFFIHGSDDKYIPNQMSIDIYNKKAGKKKLYIAPNADHAESYWKNRKEYDNMVGEFLSEIGID